MSKFENKNASVGWFHPFFFDNVTGGILKYVEFTFMPVGDIWLSCTVYLVTYEELLIWNSLHLAYLK